jgi:N-acetylglutamate synthase and related acetyltransferases
METTIRFANIEDEEQLRDLLVSYDMDLAGEIEEHVVAECGNEIIAGGMLSQIDHDLYHLEVLAVNDQWQRTGAGRLLLSRMVKYPWVYCHTVSPDDQTYVVTTVARGDAVPFYKNCGFEPCSFDELTVPYNEQCNECPSRENCQPVPMIFRRG